MLKQPDLINEKLKSLYKSVQDEQIPDRFLTMLEQLDEVEKQSERKSEASQEGLRNE